LSSATKWELDDQGFNIVEFYHNIIVTFNERIDWDSNYELNRKTEMWIKDTLRWWQEYVHDVHYAVCPTNVISAVFLGYKEAWLPSAPVAKIATGKKATSPRS
jgi:hypothetical protein